MTTSAMKPSELGSAVDHVADDKAFGAPILIVDDQKRNILALQAVLEPLGEPVHAAHSGTAALKLVLEHEFAIIVLDVQMPGMDGLETAGLIRQRDKSSRTPILFLTAHDADHESVVQGYALGAVDFVFKSITVPEVIRSKVSVYVELYKARLREQALLRERERLSFVRLSGPPTTSVVSNLYGNMPLAEQSPDRFEHLASEYSAMFDAALERRILEVDSDLTSRFRAMAEQLGDLAARPRDVIDLHQRAMRLATKDAPAQKARACAEEGRFMILELMGYLASYYRRYISTSGAAPTPQDSHENEPASPDAREETSS